MLAAKIAGSPAHERVARPRGAGPFEVRADWRLLARAFSDDTAGVQWYLHVPTGRVLRATESPTDPRVFSVDDGFLAIERARSKEQYRWMERYIMQLDDRELAAELSHAIAGKRAFQRFKSVLAENPGRLEEWQSFRAAELTRHMHLWLDAHDLVVPWEEPSSPRFAPTGARAPTPHLHTFEMALVDLGIEDLEILLTTASFLFRRGRERDAQEDGAADFDPDAHD